MMSRWTIVAILTVAMQVVTLWRIEQNRSDYIECQEHVTELYDVLTWHLDVLP